MSAKQIPLADHLKNIPAKTRPIVDAAIKTVKGAAPNADEITYNSQAPRSKTMMWKIGRYGAGGGDVGGLRTLQNPAALFFLLGRERGAGRRLFQWHGKTFRTV